MHILYLADIRFPLERANGIQTMETCHALARRGHHVRLVVRPDTAPVARDPFTFYGLTPEPRLAIERVPVPGAGTLRRAAYLFTALVRAATPPADVVLTRDLGVASVLLRLPRRDRARNPAATGLRPPLVYESHGVAAVVGAAIGTMLSTATSATTLKQQRLLRREARVWAGAEGYVTITGALRDDLEERFGPRSTCEVIADGVRLSDSRSFRAPVARESPLVVYAGHLYPWKGVDTLVDALALLPAAHGMIVGGHPAEPDLSRVQARAAALGVDSRITFTGLLPPAAVGERLAMADVLVLPNSATAASARYTSPLKLFEYLAAGRPIVASSLPALREVLRHESNALLVEPDNPLALADAIARVAADSVLAWRLARTAFDEAANYSWDARAARLEVVCDRAIGRVQAPARPR